MTLAWLYVMLSGSIWYLADGFRDGKAKKLLKYGLVLNFSAIILSYRYKVIVADIAIK